MGPSNTCLLAMFAVVVLALSRAAEASVVTTCKAAADSNKQVSYDFCVSELSKHRGSHDADAWGLAKLATKAGAANAEKAVADIKDRLTKPSMEAKRRVLFQQCQKLYNGVDSAFLRAHDMINDRKYAAGKGQVALAISFAQKCDDLLGNTVATPSPLTKYSSYTGNMAVVCVTITDLIK